MNQQQLYSVAIYEREILLSDFTSGFEKRYIVSQDELTKLFRFNRSIYLKPFPGLIWMKASLDGNDEYLITFKRQKRKIIYSHQQKMRHINVEFPNMAVKASVIDNEINIDRVYAFAGELAAKSPLYDLALPNIGYADVCEGSQKIYVKDCVREAIVTKFFETPFNHHQNLVGKEAIPFLDYIKKYHGKMPFRTLKKIGSGRQLLETR